MRTGPFQRLPSGECLLWLAACALMGVATVGYLLDGTEQRFETLPPFAVLREWLAPLASIVQLPAVMKFHLADFAWGGLAAVMAGQLARSLSPLSKLLLLLAAASSWELLQHFRVAGGVFDVRDVTASLAAGLLVWVVHVLLVWKKEGT